LIKELDTVVLTRDIPDLGLQAGDVGAVVLVHREGTACEVEFVTLSGETVGVVTLPIDAIRLTAHDEIPHVRRVAQG
jgi:hypothetical protein